MRISDWSSDVCSSDLLAHQLASDRSPGACHQHPPAMDRLAHHFAVEHRLRAAQKLGHVDVAQIQFAHPAVLELGELRQRSEEHTSELQSLMRISYAVFCLKKKKTYKETHPTSTTKIYT